MEQITYFFLKAECPNLTTGMLKTLWKITSNKRKNIVKLLCQLETS